MNQGIRTVAALLAAVLLFTACAAADAQAAYLSVGDRAEDFSVTLSDGTRVTLQELLETKELVLLNFWATWCDPCRREFPALQEAYSKYSDRVAVVALSIDPRDNANEIEDFKAALGLTTLPLGQDTTGVSARYRFEGIPTSVAIDRFGVICWMESGMITDAEAFERLFLGFLGEEYTQSRVGYALPAAWPDAAGAPEATLQMALSADGRAAFSNSSHPLDWPFLPDADGAVRSTNGGQDGTRAVLHIHADGQAGDALVFDYAVSAERGYDLLEVLVDGAYATAFSGERQGTYACGFEAAGRHTVTLAYRKDRIGADGDDCARVDNVRLLSGAEAAVALAENPAYPQTLTGTAVEITPLNASARALEVQDPSSFYRQMLADADAYVIGAETGRFRVRIGDALDPAQMALVNTASGRLCLLAEAAYDADGFIVELPLDAAGRSSANLIALYPTLTYSTDALNAICAFADEAKLRSFLETELPAYAARYGIPYRADAVTWAYAQAEAPAGMAVYTVRFTDAAGRPVAGVMAQLCDDTVCRVLPSDENGTIQVTLEAKPYEVHVLSVPAGYAAAPQVYRLSEAGGEITVPLADK